MSRVGMLSMWDSCGIRRLERLETRRLCSCFALSSLDLWALHVNTPASEGPKTLYSGQTVNGRRSRVPLMEPDDTPQPSSKWQFTRPGTDGVWKMRLHLGPSLYAVYGRTLAQPRIIKPLPQLRADEATRTIPAKHNPPTNMLISSPRNQKLNRPRNRAPQSTLSRPRIAPVMHPLGTKSLRPLMHLEPAPRHSKPHQTRSNPEQMPFLSIDFASDPAYVAPRVEGALLKTPAR